MFSKNVSHFPAVSFLSLILLVRQRRRARDAYERVVETGPVGHPSLLLQHPLPPQGPPDNPRNGVRPHHPDLYYNRTRPPSRSVSAYQQALYLLPNPKEDPKLWYETSILYDRYGSLDHAEEAFSSVFRMRKGQLVSLSPIATHLINLVYKI
jgi:hypothetical protein